MRRLAPVFFLSLLISPVLLAQRDYSDIQITTTDLGNGIYMLKGAGGNLGVSVGEDGVFLIDDQMAPLTEKIQAALAELSDTPVRYVINTHYHGDHVGGNENLGKAGAVVVAHENVRKRMTADQFTPFFNRETPAYPEGAWPVITFNDTIRFHANGDTIHLFFAPGAHTDGDAIVWFEKANVIHMGDAFWDYYPFIDFEAGGTIDGLIASLDRALVLADEQTRIIPGHGETVRDKSELAAFREVMVTARARVAAAKTGGKSLEEVKAAKLTAEWDEAMGQWFITPGQFVHFIYATLP